MAIYNHAKIRFNNGIAKLKARFHIIDCFGLCPRNNRESTAIAVMILHKFLLKYHL
ncbi:hypothetical protein [Helicobacter sp.]|uniref:hypothetical protein n=1 Tax=Helicobacter sp. TaxID=218 RepID=UPI0025B9CA84|nr:hypothetical protein [Helicobacter sp.]MCI5633016.1 hypothetical protein [Helicobacter sp.]